MRADVGWLVVARDALALMGIFGVFRFISLPAGVFLSRLAACAFVFLASGRFEAG